MTPAAMMIDVCVWGLFIFDNCERRVCGGLFALRIISDGVTTPYCFVRWCR